MICEEGRKMFCTKCGAELPDGTLFCTKCGKRFEGSPSEDAAAAQERLNKFEAERTEALRTERARVQAESGGEAADTVLPIGSTTPVAQFLDDGDLMYRSDLDEKEAKRAAKAELKDAKAAYKDARKAAGKSSAPKVIAIIVAVLVVAGAAAGAGWWFAGQQGQASSAVGEQAASSESASDEPESAASAESSSASADSASSASDATSSNGSSASSASETSSSASTATQASSSSASAASEGPAGGIQSYIGTWEGELVATDSTYGSKRCYGAEGHPLKLTIKDISSTGKITADAEMLYHGHEKVRQDISSSELDEVIEVKDLVGTFKENGSFEFAKDDGGYDVSISVSTVDKQDGTRTLEVVAKSNDGSFTDSYTLAKQS